MFILKYLKIFLISLKKNDVISVSKSFKIIIDNLGLQDIDILHFTETIKNNSLIFKFYIEKCIYKYFSKNRDKVQDISFHNGKTWITNSDTNVKFSDISIISFTDFSNDYLRLVPDLFGNDINFIELIKNDTIRTIDKSGNKKYMVTYEDCEQFVNVIKKMVDIYKKEQEEDENYTDSY